MLDQPTSVAHEAPRDRSKFRNGILVYLAILATVFVIASLAMQFAADSAAKTAAHRIEQLQTDTNDNLCNQSAYQGGTTCEGGDANGGSFGGL